MRLLMDLAQALACRNGCSVISVGIVREAVSMLELQSGTDADLVLQFLGMSRPQRSSPPEHIIRLIEGNADNEPLPLTPRVREMLDAFGEDYVFYRTPTFSGYPDGALPTPQRKGEVAGRQFRRQQPRHDEHGAYAVSGGDDVITSSDDETGDHPDTEAEDDSEAALDASMAPKSLLELSRTLEDRLRSALFGQDAAIATLARGIMYQALRGERHGPLATLFLVGPPATGKSFSAALIADALGPEWPLKTIDLATLQSRNQAFVLTGMSKGYDGAMPGELTDFVRRNPRSVVVLDNLDKAHPNNQNVLLPLFDTGFLTDQFGFYRDGDVKKEQIAAPDVDFRNVILILTTNAASGTMQSPDFQAFLDTHPDQANDTVLALLAREQSVFQDGPLPSFSPDMLSRLSAELLLIYRPLTLPALERIAGATWDHFVKSLQAAFACKVQANNRVEVLRAATLAFGSALDARKVAGPALENRLFGEVMDCLGKADSRAVPVQVRFQLSDEFTSELADLLSALRGADPITELRRKQRRLEFDVGIDDTGSLINVVLARPHWAAEPRALDFSTADPLQVIMPACRFSDIAGHGAVKQRLREIVKLLRDPRQLERWNVGLPRGVLLYGSPGTGKTMLAKALAAEADLPFIATTGPDLLETRRMHEVFERARHYAPSILFIDEIEILGSREGRGAPLAINQLLAELDGFNGSSGGVFTVAASNYPDRLDPAILRAGRIELLVEIPALDPDARRHFLERLKELPGGRELDLDSLVTFSAGLTGAELERVRRELALELVRAQQTELTQADAVEMINVVKYGERRDAQGSREMLERTACHEAGHAIVCHVLFPSRKLEQITIVPRARHAGLTAWSSDGPAPPMSRHDVLNQMACCLGGRVAQQMKFGNEAGLDAGASDDLLKATVLATRAIAEWGLDEIVGDCVLKVLGEREIAPRVVPHDRLAWWFGEARVRAQHALEGRGPLIDTIMEELLAKETVSSEHFEMLVNGGHLTALTGQSPSRCADPDIEIMK